jgi:hypothetical protein
MGSIQCNVEYEYQLSICCGTKENHRKPWSSWPVAGPSGCKLISSQQSGIKYASPNVSPYLCCCVFSFSFLFFPRKLLFTIIFSTSVSKSSHSHVTTDGQSICLDVEPLLVLLTRCLLLLTITVVFWWGALSDDWSGLSIVCQSVHQ